jgi:hypothetical protein
MENRKGRRNKGLRRATRGGEWKSVVESGAKW